MPEGPALVRRTSRGAGTNHTLSLVAISYKSSLGPKVDLWENLEKLLPNVQDSHRKLFPLTQEESEGLRNGELVLFSLAQYVAASQWANVSTFAQCEALSPRKNQEGTSSTYGGNGGKNSKEYAPQYALAVGEANWLKRGGAAMQLQTMELARQCAWMDRRMLGWN